MVLCVTALLIGLTMTAAEPPVVRHDVRPLLAVDFGAEADRARLWEELHLLAGLQGLVNRDVPQLLLQAYPADDYWWAKLRAPGGWLADREVVETTSLDELLTRFASAYRGAVVYDPSVYASSNLASTVAGVENLLPVRFSDAPDSLYARLIASGRLPVGRDLRGVAPDKTSAYRWLLDNYVAAGRTNPAVMAYYIDQYWISAPTSQHHQNHTLFNHDFFIARRGTFFDLLPWDDETPVDDRSQAVGSDYETLKALLSAGWTANEGRPMHVGGFVPWAIKYTNFRSAGSQHEPVPTEWKYAEILSSYTAYMDADAEGPTAMVNASFYQHFPLRDHYPQPARPTEAQLRERGLIDERGLVVPGNYLWFYVGDYDAAAWLYQMFPERWDDPERGSLPLGWAINPNLAERMPLTLHYTRETATPNDWFVAGDSGAGYLNPGALEPPRPHSGLPSGLDAWREHNARYLPRWDLGIVGFVIDGFARGLTSAGLDTYAQIAPEGIVAQKIEETGVHNGMPYVRMRSDLGGDALQQAAQMAPSLITEGWDFATYRTILQTPGWHRRLVDELRRLRPEAPLRVVDPYTFMALVKRYAERPAEHRLPRWPSTTVAWPNEGLQRRPNADGPAEEVTIDGRPALRQVVEPGRVQYIYFRASDRYPRDPEQPLRLTIEYRDLSGVLSIEYDGIPGPYTAVTGVQQTGTGEWRTLEVTLAQPLLDHRQNNASDLRLINVGGELLVRRVALAP